MTAALFLVFFLHAATVARVTRFVVFDSLIDEPRDWLIRKLTIPLPAVDVNEAIDDDFELEWPPRGIIPFLRNKAITLIDCPWCVSIWVSAATLAATYLFTDYTVPLPLFWWLGLSMVATMAIDWSDGSRNIAVSRGE